MIAREVGVIEKDEWLSRRFTYTRTDVRLKRSTRPLTGRNAFWADRSFAAQIKRARCMPGLRQPAPKILASTPPWRGVRPLALPGQVRAQPWGTSAHSHPKDGYATRRCTFGRSA